MSRLPSIGSENTVRKASGSNDLRDVDVNQFLNLLIAELQNQDPLNPMDNQEMLQQIGQIREISSTNQLTDTLAAVMAGQNLSTASGLIGKNISALTDDGKNVEGTVDRVSVQERDDENQTRLVRVHIGDHSVELNNIRGIVNAE